MPRRAAEPQARLGLHAVEPPLAAAGPAAAPASWACGCFMDGPAAAVLCFFFQSMFYCIRLVK